MPTMVFLGCHAAYGAAEERDPGTGEARVIPLAEREILDGKRRTHIELPEEWTFGQCLRAVTDPQGIWANHSPHPAPAWVSSSDQQLADALGRHYGCEVRDYLPAGERQEFADLAFAFGGSVAGG